MPEIPNGKVLHNFIEAWNASMNKTDAEFENLSKIFGVDVDPGKAKKTNRGLEWELSNGVKLYKEKYRNKMRIATPVNRQKTTGLDPAISKKLVNALHAIANTAHHRNQDYLIEYARLIWHDVNEVEQAVNIARPGQRLVDFRSASANMFLGYSRKIAEAQPSEVMLEIKQANGEGTKNVVVDLKNIFGK